jgi:hypothetical protein
MSAENAEKDSYVANKIWQVHAALDAVYGRGFSREHADTVAQFMQALSTQEVAAEIAALREIIASGSGAITIGLEHAAPSA